MDSWLVAIDRMLLIGLVAGLAIGAIIAVIVHFRSQQQRQLMERQYQERSAQQLTTITSLQAQLKQVDALQSQLKERELQWQQAQQQLRQRENQLTEIRTRADSNERHHAEQMALLRESKAQLKTEFAQLANEIFEQKQRTFNESSSARLTALLAPFNQQIEHFRQRVDDIHTKDAEGRSQLLTQLNLLKDMNNQLNKQATDLTKALKGDKKLQGNWGELQVERILESAGLQKGREFEREPSFKGDHGQNLRPDFILYLPEGKHIIIDSKVSLVAYQAVISAQSEPERNQALREHIAATRQHIRNLSGKNYPSLSALNAPDFVLMFMPIESAFIAAFEADPNLFNEAFEQNIVVVTPTTLLATLRTVANLWSLERQNENAKTLYALAGKIYDKVAVFSHKMEKLGQQIKGAERSYDDALGTLTDGRGSMLSYVKKLKAIGAPTAKTMSDTFEQKASDELDHIDEPNNETTASQPTSD